MIEIVAPMAVPTMTTILIGFPSESDRDPIGANPLGFTDLLNYSFTIDNDVPTKISLEKIPARTITYETLVQSNIYIYIY